MDPQETPIEDADSPTRPGNVCAPPDFATLWREWHARLDVHARQMGLGNPLDREEAVSDALCRLWQNRDRYDGRHAWTTWAWKVARNAFIDRIRALSRQARREGRFLQVQATPITASCSRSADDADAPAQDLSVPDHRACWRPEETLLRKETSALIDRALSRLAPRDREILHLRFGQGMSIAETARVTGMAEGTVKSRIHRCRKHLQDLKNLQEEES